jgi:phosphoribosylanthranilate isomerase
MNGRQPRPGAVKVCGLTSPEDARCALEAGADMVGLVFCESPRRVTPEGVAPWVRELREAFPEALWVGVFLPGDAGRIPAVLERVALDVLQIHGLPVPQAAYAARRTVLAAVRVGSAPLPEPDLVEPQAFALVLDTFDPRRPGGTGRSFPWELAQGWSRRRRIVLSGGLRPENVGEAIRQLRPFAVDASSGLELAPGRKDPVRVRDFVRRARAAFGDLEAARG